MYAGTGMAVRDHSLKITESEVNKDVRYQEFPEVSLNCQQVKDAAVKAYFVLSLLPPHGALFLCLFWIAFVENPSIMEKITAERRIPWRILSGK